MPDAVLSSIAIQIPMAVLIFIVTDRLNRTHASEREKLLSLAITERKDQREWFDGLVKGVTQLVETNTTALRANTLALGEANAARLACPATGRVDERGDPFRRRADNHHDRDDG